MQSSKRTCPKSSDHPFHEENYMPNFLLLMSDEHNPLYSSVYGHPSISTPNMERLAERGTVFENAYCPSPLCLPSRSAFMAGRRVHQIQAYSNCNTNLGDYPSYGKILADQNVHTAYIGKTDVYRPGSQLGFTQMLQPGDRKPPGDTHHGRTPLTIRSGAAQRANGYGPRKDAGANDLKNVDRAVRWLRATAPELAVPWTLTVNIGNPHFPHYVTPDLWDQYPRGGDLPNHGPDCDSAHHPYAADLRAHFETDQFTEEQTRCLRRGYLGCVTFVDRQLGRLLDALEETGQSADTVVAYASDHGDMLGKFGMWWKCSLYEDSVRVPLIAAGPGFTAGTRAPTSVDLLDLQATIFRTTGAERPDDWSGSPLQELPADDPERTLFAEYHGHGTRSGAFLMRKGRWKLIHYGAAPHQLFDLEEDPHELRNLFAERADVAAELEAELHRICDPASEDQRAHDFERQQLEAICRQSGEEAVE